MNCRICNWNCVVKTFGFYKCYFNIYGIKYNKAKDEIKKFGVEIKDFQNQDFNIDNSFLVNGNKVEVNKIDDENVTKFNEYKFYTNLNIK